MIPSGRENTLKKDEKENARPVSVVEADAKLYEIKNNPFILADKQRLIEDQEYQDEALHLR